MTNKSRFTYANVVSTLALFLALSGGVAFAASKVHTNGIFKRAVTSGKIALGAVRSNQIADGAVGAKQIANGAGVKRRSARSRSAPPRLPPSNLQFPVFFAASPVGGSLPVPAANRSPTRSATPAGRRSRGSSTSSSVVPRGPSPAAIAAGGDCRVFFEIRVNGEQTGGGELSTSSTTPEQVEHSVGASPEIDPLTPVTNKLTVDVGSNGACTAGSTVDSTRFRVLDFG